MDIIWRFFKKELTKFCSYETMIIVGAPSALLGAPETKRDSTSNRFLIAIPMGRDDNRQ